MTENRTFSFGQQGEITMKSNWGQPVQADSAVEPQEPRMPSIDEVIEQNNEQAAQRLQQQYKQAKGLIDKQIEYGRQAILNQYEIKRIDMKRKHSAEADPKRKQAILDQTLSVKSQTEAKIQALTDKHAPENQELDARMQAEVQKLTQQAQMRSVRLQAIRDASSAGIITDPAVVQQAEYNAAYGVTIPLSRFKSQSPSPKERKAQLATDIRSLTNRLERFSPSEKHWHGTTRSTFVDDTTGEERTLDQNDPNDAVIIENMKALSTARDDMVKELQSIYIAESPTLRKQLEDIQRYRDAKKIAANGGSLNIEGSIRKQIGEQNKGKKTITQRNKKTGQTRVSNDGGKTWQIQ